LKAATKAPTNMRKMFPGPRMEPPIIRTCGSYKKSVGLAGNANIHESEPKYT
jgi:hypothetical protein